MAAAIALDTRGTDGKEGYNCKPSKSLRLLCYRNLVIAGKKGHVASFDWRTGTLHSELQLQETVRDVT